MRAFWNDKKNVVLILILILGFLFRIGGIMHGLPFSYYPDEQHFMNRALSFGTGDFNPHWFHKPAFYMYILFFEYSLFFLFGKLIGLFASVGDFASLYINDKTIFLIIGRATTSLFGMGMIFLTYRLGRKLYNRSVGLIAALMLTFTFAHVRSCQDIKADVPAAFFSLLSYVFITRILYQGLKRDYLLAGLFVGLGTATKYSPIVFAVPIVLAHLMFLRSQRPVPWRKLVDSRLLLGLSFIFIGFFLGSPFNVIDTFFLRANVLPLFQYNAMAADVAANFSFSRILLIFWRPLAHVGGVLLNARAQGNLLGAISLLALLFILLRGGRGGRLIAFTVIGFIYISGLLAGSYAEPRHLNIIYPFLSLAAAECLYRLVTTLFSKRTRFLGLSCGAMMFILPALLVTPSAVRIARYNYVINQRDSRTLAKEWIEKNIAAGTKILVDDYCIPLKMSPQKARGFQQKAESEAEKGPFTAHAIEYYYYYSQTVKEPTYELQEISHPWWKNKEELSGTYMLSSNFDRDFGNPLKEWGVSSLEDYREEGYQYLVTITFLMDMYLKSSRGDSFPSFLQFYEDVERDARLVHRIKPFTPQGPGPEVLIYRL